MEEIMKELLFFAYKEFNNNNYQICFFKSIQIPSCKNTDCLHLNILLNEEFGRVHLDCDINNKDSIISFICNLKNYMNAFNEEITCKCNKLIKLLEKIIKL